MDASRLRVFMLAVLVACLATALRAQDIAGQSLWTDELFSRYYADLFSLKYLWTTGLFHEDSPPLYYMVVKGWMGLFGTSEAAIRSLSLVASVLTLPLIYLLGKELFDARRGVFGMLVFAMSPMQIGFAQEARTYALLLIPVGMTLLAVAQLLRGDARARVLFLYGIGAILALYCHATAVFFITACNAIVITAIVADRGNDRRAPLVRWIITNAVVGLVTAPELMAIVTMSRSGSGIEWIPPFRPADVIRALSPVIVGSSTPNRFPGAELSLFLLVCLAGAILASRLARRAWLVLVAIPAVFIALIAVASLYHPIFIARVFSWLGIPLALLIAHALATASRFRTALIVVAAVACLTGLSYQFAEAHNEPWRDLLDQLGPQLARADQVVLAPATDPTPFAYYSPYLAHIQIWDSGRHFQIETGALPERLGTHWITREQLINDISSGENVWLVLRTTDIPTVNRLLAEVPPPRQQIERLCDNVVCIVALSWSRHE
jgi:uncharacterized membrane protein